jgi:D-tyrosyl-tRNA(Tyr) deacylase
MIGLLQRVTRASVTVEEREIARIGRGILVLVGVQREDTSRNIHRLAERLLGYRVFADETGRMNRNVGEIAGGVLLVPQFTLAADTGRGMRASFTSAAEPALASAYFDELVTQIRSRHANTEAGLFGADMQVALVNDGPVTFWLHA